MDITTFLMFTGRAEEAINYYLSILPGSRIKNIERYTSGQPGAEGSVKRALVSLAGRDHFFIDSPVKHEFGFTPAISLFVTCESVQDIERTFQQLSEGGQILMPLGEYPFSKKFGWLNDKFGVSWQLMLGAP